jgi:hypothetical protein
VQLIGAGACHPDLIPELCAQVVRGELSLSPHVRGLRPDEPLPAPSDALLIVTP